MSTSFEIEYWWTERRVPLPFTSEDYVDATALFLGLEHFLSRYQGEFVIHIDDLELRFELDPDLSTVFEEIPAVLQKLHSENRSPVELYFFEQGTDLILLLERQEDAINIHFQKGLATGQRFTYLPDSGFSVLADLFLKEWIQFTQVVLDALVSLEPGLTDEEGYQEYRARLLALRPRDNSRKTDE
jgi:hypothetical protein